MWRFFRDFLIYGLASVLGKIAAVFLMPIYTNILTKEEYGAMALIISCKGIIDLLSNLNIHSGVARDYYEETINRKSLVSTGFLSILSISLTILFVGLLSQNFWTNKVLGLDERYKHAFVVMLCSMPCGSLMSYFSILTRFRKKPVKFAIGSIVQLVFQILISIVGVVFLRAGIVSIFVGLLVSELLAVFYFAYLNRNDIGFEFNKGILKRILVFSLPTLPAILAGWVDNSLGQILIGRYISMEELGVYSIALSLSSIFTLISYAFNNVWFPFLYENYKKLDFRIQINKLFTVMVFGLIVICIILSLFSHELILLLSNPGYLNACKYLTLLCIPMCFYLLFPFSSSGISISRETKYIAKAYMAGSVSNIIFLVIIIQYWGVIAVPICLSVSRIVTYCVLYMISEKRLTIKLPNHLLAVLIVITLICYGVVIYETPLIYRLLMAVIAGLMITIYVVQRLDVKKLYARIIYKRTAIR